MGIILLPKGYSAQPRDVAEVDWSHPFLQNVLAIVDPVAGVERVTGAPLTPLFGSEEIKDGPYGKGFYTGNNAKWSFKGIQPADPGANREVSFFALTSILSTPTQTYAGIVGAQAPSQTGLITTSVASRLDWYWSNRAALNILTLAANKTYAAYGRANIVAANTVQGAGGEFEKAVGTFAAGTGSAGAMGYLTDWYLGGDHRYATSRFIEQLVHLVVIVNRYCSEEEFQAIAANPWQLFKPKSIILPVTAGGGGGISQAFLAAVETDLAQALTAPATLTFGAATETDTGLQFAHIKSKAFATSTETSSAQQLASAKSLTFLAGNEAEFAQALTPSKSRAFGQSSETDSAEAFVQAGATPLAQTSETSTAHAFAKAKVKALGQAVDGQTALALIARRSKALVQAAETSAAQAISKAKVKAFSTSQEIDNAQSLGLAGPKVIALGRVGESDAALPLSREGAGQLPTGGGGGGRVGGAVSVRSTRKLNELFEEIFKPTATIEQAVEKVEAAFKDKPKLEEVVAVIEEAERKAAMTATEAAVRRATAVAKRLENLRRELEAEEEAVVTLLLL